MKNLQQPRYIQQLFEDNILTQEEYMEQKEHFRITMQTLHKHTLQDICMHLYENDFSVHVVIGAVKLSYCTLCYTISIFYNPLK